ncbi:hypothetical protein SLA2020_351690 [Shorea laevis]
MDFLSCIIFLCLTWILIQTFHIIQRSKANPRKLPPGPKPFPVIGNLLDLGDKPHKSLAKLAEAHGPIMCLKLGRVTTIIISSADTAKQVLQTHDQLLCNRTIPDALRAHKQDVFGLPWIPVSTRWRNLRKICNGQLFASRTLDSNQDIRRKKVQELLAETHQSCLTVRQWILAERLLRLRLICYQTPFFRWIWPTQILTQLESSRRSSGIS